MAQWKEKDKNWYWLDYKNVEVNFDPALGRVSLLADTRLTLSTITFVLNVIKNKPLDSPILDVTNLDIFVQSAGKSHVGRGGVESRVVSRANGHSEDSHGPQSFAL